MSDSATSCGWCSKPATLLCDGKLTGPGSCSAAVCRACARKVGEQRLGGCQTITAGDMTMIVCSRGRAGRRRDSVDLCPFCQARAAEGAPTLKRAVHDDAVLGHQLAHAAAREGAATYTDERDDLTHEQAEQIVLDLQKDSDT
jgi:hypothetical protein